MPESREQRRLSAEWEDLKKKGEAPELVGRTAEEAERDKTRARPLMPTERRRRGRKISPTLPPDLVDDLRGLCADLGYTDKEGRAMIASPVVVALLRLALEAYHAGKIELREGDLVTTGWKMQWTE